MQNTTTDNTFTQADRLALGRLVGAAITARGEYGAKCYAAPEQAEAAHAAALLAEDAVMDLIHRIPTTD